MVRRGRPVRRRQAQPLATLSGPPPSWTRSILGPMLGALAVIALLWVAGLAGRDAELPSPTPVPSPSGPLLIRFSTALDPITGEAGTATARFRAGDEFAYSVHLAAPAGRDTVWVEIARITNGTTQVVQAASSQGIVASWSRIAFSVRAVDLLEAWGPGEYVMRMRWTADGPIIATGRFTLVETASQS
ncbi:MAG TPA: hypothetical protein VJA85_08415 [Candidatus Limnocylindria bacterium]|nr:hypothetical protein [Candidatus Limnocylindria bacterium]